MKDTKVCVFLCFWYNEDAQLQVWCGRLNELNSAICHTRENRPLERGFTFGAALLWYTKNRPYGRRFRGSLRGNSIGRSIVQDTAQES